MRCVLMRLVLILLALTPFRAMAEAALPDGLPPGLPDALLKQLSRNPDPWLRLTRDLIRGYGDGQAIGQPALVRYIALERAGARALALQEVLRADLDLDGAVTADEAAAYADTLSARARIRWGRVMDAADLQGDGALGADEVTGHATAEAAAAVEPVEEAAILALMAFDADRDGLVSLAELDAVFDGV